MNQSSHRKPLYQGACGARPACLPVDAGRGIARLSPMDEPPPPPETSEDTAPKAAEAVEGRRGRTGFWVVLGVVVILDQLTKYLVFAYDPAFALRPPLPGASRPWSDHAVTIWCHLNQGAAWSMGASRPWLIALITLVLIPVLFLVYWRGFRPKGRPIEHLAFGAILGGALGNAWDRIVAMLDVDPVIKGVRDFIHADLGFWPCDPWPTFNVADSALTGAVVVLVVLGLFPRRGA